MAIVQTIDNAYQLEQAFKDYGREDNFSRKGLHALFDYFENLSEDIGEDYALDVVGLCCDYNEYESIEEFMQNNTPDFDMGEFNESDDAEKLNMIQEYLENNTSVVCCEDDCIMYQCF